MAIFTIKNVVQSIIQKTFDLPLRSKTKQNNKREREQIQEQHYVIKYTLAC